MNRILISTILFFMLVFNCQASVFFSDDFEWGSDWNTSMGSTVPIAQGWSGGILAEEGGGSLYVGYVNSAGAKQGSRGFIQYWDQVNLGYAQDCWLNTNNITFPDHYYLGYWFKVDSNWDWGSVASLKLIKTNFADVGNTTWDIAWTAGGNFLDPNEFFVVDGTNWTGSSGCERTLITDDAVRASFGCWSGIDDGQWHYFIWDFNHTAGTLGLKIDGIDAFQMSMKASPYGEPYESGVNGSERWNFGGNISAGGGGVSEMYTAYDDIILCTTEAEALAFLGVDSTAYDSPTITGPVDSSTTSTSVEIEGTYTVDPDLPDQSVIVTWTLGGSSGFAVAALGVFSCTVPDLSFGANSIVFEITDSNSGTDSDTTVVTRTEQVKTTKINGSATIKNATIHQ